MSKLEIGLDREEEKPFREMLERVVASCDQKMLTRENQSKYYEIRGGCYKVLYEIGYSDEVDDQ